MVTRSTPPPNTPSYPIPPPHNLSPKPPSFISRALNWLRSIIPIWVHSSTNRIHGSLPLWNRTWAWSSCNYGWYCQQRCSLLVTLIPKYCRIHFYLPQSDPIGSQSRSFHQEAIFSIPCLPIQSLLQHLEAHDAMEEDCTSSARLSARCCGVSMLSSRNTFTSLCLISVLIIVQRRHPCQVCRN